MLNKKLLRDTMDKVNELEQNPLLNDEDGDIWFQGEWGAPRSTYISSKHTCGTAACFAGWACLVTHPGSILEGVGITHPDIDFVKQYGTDSIPGLAKELLGLNPNQMDDLFKANNTIDDLNRIVNRILKD